MENAARQELIEENQEQLKQAAADEPEQEEQQEAPEVETKAATKAASKAGRLSSDEFVEEEIAMFEAPEPLPEEAVVELV